MVRKRRRVLMKEIDFLPEWYKHSRRKRMSYQTQYAVILAVLLVMAGWSFYTARSVSNAQAQNQMSNEEKDRLKEAQKEYSEIEKQLGIAGEQKKLIEKLDTKLSVSDVMAELSHIVDSRILLTSMDITAEKLVTEEGTASTVRVRNSKEGGEDAIRYKLVIRGLAGDGSDVAGLIGRLEESEYFAQVVPGFTRSKDLKDIKASEFEVSCYISNYVIRD